MSACKRMSEKREVRHFRVSQHPVTGDRTAGTVQGILQNEDFSFFQWPLSGALSPLKAWKA